jgi:pilus assembly protein CpaB
MRLMFGLVLVAGIGLAGTAVMMAKNYIGAYQQALANERAVRKNMVETVPVYVAATQLKYGDHLSRDHTRLVDWPENALPEGAFLKEENLFPNDKPRMVLRIIEKGEPLLAVKVTEPGEAAGITTRLERGMRAFALRVDVASGVSGFLRPGDRVDVYWTGRVSRALSGQGQGDVTRLIEAGVELIAIDQSAASDVASTTIARTVTVAATPQQVASLAQAQSTGKLSLSLVGIADDVVADTIEVDQASLLGLTREAAPAEVEPEEKICTIRTRRGAEVVTIPIPCTE